ncbi:MAG: hypothetical protein LBU14_02845 [Candidatus Peribacteria bacterium]|jgi:hypothetical protein|nr:hypothetical protein [Candidatus Peribacteria bacterium]
MAQVRLSNETKKALDDLKIKTQGVKLDTIDAKISHLIWVYHSYVNNNKEKN